MTAVSFISSIKRRVRALRGWPLWIALLFLAALVPTLVEAVLLSFGTGFFGDGFNSVALDRFWQVPAFILFSLVFDAGLQLLFWSLLIPVLGWAGVSGLQAWWILLVVGAGVPSLLAAYRYNVYSIAGDMFNVALVGDSSLSSSSSMASELVTGASLLWTGLSVAGVIFVIGVSLALGRIERRHPGWRAYLTLPSARSAFTSAFLILFACALVSRVPNASAKRLRYGLKKKSADITMSSLLAWTTDFDGDGFGPLSAIRDPAPFDASRFPYALEVPGNGLDENGLAGDLAEAPFGPSPVSAPLPEGGARPHVLLIYLESFRQDLLGREVNGREVTPFLNGLAAEGASTEQAWTHSAWTLASRSQLFGGRLVQRPGDSSLIDDFKALGYEVLHFSGQDESYGDSEPILGVERTDHFYDARQDKDRRSSRTTAPVSLQVSWKVLHERVAEHLEGYDGERPLFLYVNLTDTHFPYLHGELDDILGVPELERSTIRADHAREVIEGYANTAANVDRGAERVTQAFREAIGGGDHAILVLADHGEAFYEKGRLGHGQSLDPGETRIPFIVWGMGGEWPVPLGPTDVRGLIRRNLAVERGNGPPTPRFVPDPQRRVLQYAPSLSRPELIGLRGLEGLFVYDFTRGRSKHKVDETSVLGSSPGDSASRLEELIWRWESARLDESILR